MSVYGTVLSRLILEGFLESPICRIPMHHAKCDDGGKSDRGLQQDGFRAFLGRRHPATEGPAVAEASRLMFARQGRASAGLSRIA